MKKKKMVTLLFVIALLAAMFFTNPGRADVHSKVKEKEGFFSIVDVSERINCLFFSFYKVEKWSMKSVDKTSYLYLGIFGQVIEL